VSAGAEAGAFETVLASVEEARASRCEAEVELFRNGGVGMEGKGTRDDLAMEATSLFKDSSSKNLY
jgi:hypothetical protein